MISLFIFVLSFASADWQPSPEILQYRRESHERARQEWAMRDQEILQAVATAGRRLGGTSELTGCTRASESRDYFNECRFRVIHRASTRNCRVTSYAYYPGKKDTCTGTYGQKFSCEVY